MNSRLRARLYLAPQHWLKRINPTRLGITLVVLACVVLIAREYFSLRATLLADIAVQARIIAENSTAALAFRDRDTTSEILSALRVSESIEAAVIVDRHNIVQASYPRPPTPPLEAGLASQIKAGGAFDPQSFFPEGFSIERGKRFTLTHLYLAQPITNKNQPLGSIFIKARLRPMYEQLLAFIGAALLALPVLGALGASLLVVGRLRGKVSQARKELYRLAYVDTVTQLPNRNVFNQRLAGMLARVRRHRHGLALLFLDLDNFKFVNDTFGHPAGDQLLLSVTQRLTGALRASDLLCRLGGDEFALILEDISGHGGAAETAKRLLQTLEAPFFVEGHEIYVSTSIGISLCPDDGTELEFLLKSADIAMYHAKEQGRNNFQFFSKELNRRAARRLELETGFRRALERNEFYMVYQPIFDLETRQITGVEALLRWQSPEGAITPDEFIPVAEESGMILPISQWTLRQTCEQIRAWREDGLDGLEVAVNLSTRQFRDPHLVSQIAEVLADTQTPPQLLWLEITETTLMTDTASALRKLNELRTLGIRLAVDDFGTGYSSLSYLKKLPIAKLKIDRSFIADLPDDGDASAITEAILALARSLRLLTVAEGVETAEQMEFLSQRGCGSVQGYHISRPVTPEKIAALARGSW